MPDKNTETENPSEALATRIAAKLVADGLIQETQSSKVCKGIATGAFDQSQWRIEIERVLDANVKEEANDAP